MTVIKHNFTSSDVCSLVSKGNHKSTLYIKRRVYKLNNSRDIDFGIHNFPLQISIPFLREERVVKLRIQAKIKARAFVKED